MASSSSYIAISRSRIFKHFFFFHKFLTVFKPIYSFCSSTIKLPNEQNPDPKFHLSIRESQPGIADNTKSRTNPDKVEDSICKMMEEDKWSTRLQTSIRKLVPLFDHNLVTNVINRNPNHALEFFQWVEELGFKHNRETHCKMIEILCKDRKLDDAKRVLIGMSEKGVDFDEDLFVLLIRGYAKSNRKWDIVKNCVKCFLKMEELGVPKTIKSYNSLLEVIISKKKYTMAEKYFDKMLLEGVVPSLHTFTLMISGFCRSSRVETADRLFKDMKSRNLLPDFVIYNTMVNGFVQVKKMDEAEKVFMEMEEREIEPLLVTYNSMINGYAQVKKMENAEKLVVEMKRRNIELDLITYNTMINGYTLVEKMEDAQNLVVEMKGRKIEPDLVTYVTMIKGYVIVNKAGKGLELVEKLKQKRFGRKVDVNLCLGRLKEDCDVEKMSESQRNVLKGVEEYIERLELLALRDAACELSELASQGVVDRRGKMEKVRETRGGDGSMSS